MPNRIRLSTKSDLKSDYRGKNKTFYLVFVMVITFTFNAHSCLILSMWISGHHSEFAAKLILVAVPFLYLLYKARFSIKKEWEEKFSKFSYPGGEPCDVYLHYITEAGLF